MAAKSTFPFIHPKAHQGSKGHLLRIVGVSFGVAVGVGTTVGSGILRTPGESQPNCEAPG